MVEVVGVIVVWPPAGAKATTVMRAMKDTAARNAVHRVRAANSFLYVEFKGLPSDLESSGLCEIYLHNVKAFIRKHCLD